MDLSLDLFYDDGNDDSNMNLLCIRIKIRSSVASLTFCCLICKICLFIS